MMHFSLFGMSLGWGRGVWAGLVVGLVVGALALGGVGNAVYAAPPMFTNTDDPITEEVDENTPAGVNIGTPISATDADETALEYGDTLTYSLGGTNATSFDIDASTGQLITKAPLDFENPRGGSNNDSIDYQVTVTVKDGSNPGVTRAVTITVQDVNEPPAAPAAPVVVSGQDDNDPQNGAESTTTLKVVWHQPENTGTGLGDYNVAYRKTTKLKFSTGDNPDTTATEAVNIDQNNRTATISGLEVDTSYHVRVQATSDEGDSPWSLVGTGSTNKEGNIPPTFSTGPIDRDVSENTSAGKNVGSPVTASDKDATSLTYRLEGPDAGLFGFVTSSGQIRTKSPLNYEDPACGYITPVDQDDTTSCTYRVTVVVDDGAGGSDAKAVDIEIDNESEPVLAPARPTVRATEKSSTSLDVSWKAPANTGPPITGYKVRYREGSSGTFLDDNCDVTGDNNCNNITDTKVTILGLQAGKSHQVQVQTIVAVGVTSVPSDLGTGSTNAANKEPRFDDRPSSDPGSTREPPGDDNTQPTYTITRDVDENTRLGQSVGTAVRAEDGDGHKRTYRLVDANNHTGDSAKFDIDESTGQIRTKSALNHEDTDGCGYDASADPTTCTYTVKVEVWDGLDTHKVEEDSDNPTVDDAILVRINVRDKEEPPAVPLVTVTAPDTTGTGNTLAASLQVNWDAPRTRGQLPLPMTCSTARVAALFQTTTAEVQQRITATA